MTLLDKILSKSEDISQKHKFGYYSIYTTGSYVDLFMCNKLLELKQKHPGYILAVVGAGHLEGMYEILNEKLKVTPNISFSFKVDLD